MTFDRLSEKALMKIRSYKGASLEKLHEAILRELGPQAVVVHRNKAGVSRFLGKPRHELIAVADDGAADAHLMAQANPMPAWEKHMARQEKKFEAMEAALERMSGDMERLTAETTATMVAGPDCAGLPPAMQDWDPRFLNKIRGQIPGLFDPEPGSRLIEELGAFFPVQESFQVGSSGGRARIVALVGPTGCGKTTTLSKLAAKWALEDRLKVGIITADTYRIAAVDQMREYALLLGLEMKVVFSAGEARRAVEAFRDKDVVLVDTPGRNFYDPVAMRGLKSVLQAMGSLRTLLLTPATLDRRGTSDLLQRYAMLAPDALVVTKIDETRVYSVFTVIAGETACPIAFLTNGQRVPEDLLSATRSGIAGLALNGAPERAYAA
jgi:flagellar biosynthesis protein FlhF